MILYSNIQVLLLTPEDFTEEGKVKPQALEDFKKADIVLNIKEHKETFVLKNRWGSIGRVDGRL